MGNIDIDPKMRYTQPGKLRNQQQTGRPKSIWVIPVKGMVETRKPPMSYESMLELIDIVVAGRLAQNTGRKVYLKDAFTELARLDKEQEG